MPRARHRRRRKRRHWRSPAALARRRASGLARLQTNLRGLLAHRPVCWVPFGTQLKVFFMWTIGDAEALEGLRQAAVEVGRRLQVAFSQGFTEPGSPDIKPEDERHHCRHNYRIVFHEGTIFLPLSRHRRH